VSPKLPVISGQEAVRALQRLGYEVVRQRGSHIRLRHPLDPTRKPLTVPDHHTLKPGLLRKLIRDAQMEIEEFVSLLESL
jgi:predicted RNA binding protein YcfA (HicA-like mRNA interferase family)